MVEGAASLHRLAPRRRVEIAHYFAAPIRTMISVAAKRATNLPAMVLA